MQSEPRVIDIVLVASNPAMIAMLHKFLRNNGHCARLRSIPQTKKALSCLRRNAPRSTASVPDLILFDFSQPGRRVLTLLEDLVFGPTPPVAPTVLLTTPSTEQLLENGAVSCGDAIMFAPKTLTGFVRKMREHQRDLFLRSVSTLCDVGPILVRLPNTISTRTDSVAELTA